MSIFDLFNLEDKVALVTGGTHGIGMACAMALGQEMLEKEGCHLVFAPDGATVYPRGPDTITRVQVPRLGDMLCGESRPGFFRGVATVVNVLFNMVGPDVALFGEKDYQQYLIIQRMVDFVAAGMSAKPMATSDAEQRENRA